jgi:broad specificity phosphatase PhoE
MTVRITYFVHGTTTDNEQDLATGQAQGELSELGIKQAKNLPKQLSESDFDVVFSSDLKRSIDSAELGFGKTHRIVQDKRLREVDYGNLAQHPCSEFKHRMVDFVEIPFPNGESYKDVERRIADFLQYLKKGLDGSHVAIVAHQAPQLALDVLLKGKSWRQAIEGDWRRKKAWQPGWEYEYD